MIVQLRFQTPLYNNPKYHKFTKKYKYEILFYTKIVLIKTRKRKQTAFKSEFQKNIYKNPRSPGKKQSFWIDYAAEQCKHSGLDSFIASFERVYYTPKTDTCILSYALWKISCLYYTTILHYSGIRSDVLSLNSIVILNSEVSISIT